MYGIGYNRSTSLDLEKETLTCGAWARGFIDDGITQARPLFFFFLSFFLLVYMFWTLHERTRGRRRRRRRKKREEKISTQLHHMSRCKAHCRAGTSKNSGYWKSRLYPNIFRRELLALWHPIGHRKTLRFIRLLIDLVSSPFFASSPINRTYLLCRRFCACDICSIARRRIWGITRVLP